MHCDGLPSKMNRIMLCYSTLFHDHAYDDDDDDHNHRIFFYDDGINTMIYTTRG